MGGDNPYNIDSASAAMMGIEAAPDQVIDMNDLRNSYKIAEVVEK